MNSKLILPAIGAGCLVFMSYHLVRTHQTPPSHGPLAEPARSPYSDVIAAAGLVEARTENIKVGSPVPGVVTEVLVAVGDEVQAGDPLFRLDDRQIVAELRVREAQLAAAQATLDRIENLPRPEEIPPSEAKVRRAEAEVVAQRDMAERREKLFVHRAVPEEEVIQRRQALTSAVESLLQAKAEDQLLKAGSWQFDKEVARVDVQRQRSLVEQYRTELDRLHVRAPVSGQVLKVDVRPGEYVGTPPDQPLVVLGDLQRLHVRIDIDEQDIPRFRPGLPGTASMRGDAGHRIPLSFVRVEPYVQPKTSLIGNSVERVDTRVLQVIYALDAPSNAGYYVGQQVDAFLDASQPQSPVAGGKAPSTATSRTATANALAATSEDVKDKSSPRAACLGRVGPILFQPGRFLVRAGLRRGSR
ncbi:MAG: HlyD family efflux transporter periplasmic adaptor subunit [Singulisphaera sp.]